MARGLTARKAKKPPFAWTQPCCVECWTGLKLKTGRADTSVNRSGTHFCCFDRREILPSQGLYMLRINPGTVPYPTVRKEE